jgi:hypothetical protein
MFDIRKIQEEVLFGSVENKSDDETASMIVFGDRLKTNKEEIPAG